MGRVAAERVRLPREVRAQRGLHARAAVRGAEAGAENPTITPIPGDVLYFGFEAWEIGNPAYGYDDGSEAHSDQGATDLAIFYGRNNLLINGDAGWVPGNVFATIEEGLAEMAAAAQDLWLRGVEGETLSFARA